MINIVGRPAAEIFARFEDVDPRSILGGGDVKYHMGATGDFHAANGRKWKCTWFRIPAISKPSIPWSIGRTRAKQMRRGEEAGGKSSRSPCTATPLSRTGYLRRDAEYVRRCPDSTVGGSVHIIVNNLIGFTTVPRDTGSSRFSSDLAKRLPVPIFHVNAEDPDAVVRVGRMALDYRYAFGTPVVIDLIGYRRHGHSEVDDPTITQPLRYRKIEAHPPTLANLC